MSGLLITFEGIDFCGKSVQSRLLYDKLQNHFGKGEKDRVLLLREPGGTIISEKIRDILLDCSLKMMNSVTELLLYEAARSQLIAEIIVPALAKKKVVICDRFYDSTTAYQGYGRGIQINMIYCVRMPHGILSFQWMRSILFHSGQDLFFRFFPHSFKFRLNIMIKGLRLMVFHDVSDLFT